MNKLSDYEQTLLSGWEDVYKKAQLTLWLLVALREGEKYMAEIKIFVEQVTHGLISPDDKSMYRALRRLTAGDVIAFRERPAKRGPDHKVYALTPDGTLVLAQFLKRNIIDVYYDPTISKLIKEG
jgi:PadR family transcriptional regulator, regulatory protein PadR